MAEKRVQRFWNLVQQAKNLLVHGLRKAKKRRFGRKMGGVGGQKVIVNHIYECAAVQAVGGPKKSFGLGRGVVLVGKGIDGAVQGNALLYAGVQQQLTIAFDEIADQIANEPVGILEREMGVGEVIHFIQTI